MRMLNDVTTDAGAIHPDLPAYMEDVAEHCHYVIPSMRQGLMTWTAYSAGSPWEAFAVLSATVEATRVRCRTQGPLACSNVAFIGPGAYEAAAQLLVMPHWIAQNVYAPVQIMLGSFLIGCSGLDRRGEFLKGAPVSFITIRRCRPAEDRALMSAPGTGWPDVSHLVSDDADDGRDVLAALLGKKTDDPRCDFMKLIRAFPLPPIPDGSRVREDIDLFGRR